MKTILFPGSFNPFTKGHADVVERGLRLFDRVVIAIGYNEQKGGAEDVAQRQEIIRAIYQEEERVQAINDLGPDPEITRFKGLGEISPDEFRHFIGPDIRLEQVTLHKSDEVAKLLEYYMGKNTMERQNFIIENLVIEEDLAEEEVERL